ncbi:Mitochondrial import receptor subunit TOM70 [Phytophthora boehmeriae]|uniref:Mitochondrial import receptor subunit TOM70 n=1 Tax=Phytophthora boehmeriae TaxID=109152 RepID=A0A8T1WRG8_9STRA|nr:Mitochondrial import receptor subunit TOM70 [Phytophthora boehmeriae]
MGMALEQLFVRVTDAPEVSPSGETCVQQVAKACGLAAGSHDEDAASGKNYTITGFADTRQQLAVACMLHWQLQKAAESGATVSVSDSAMGTCFSLSELLGCEKIALEQPGAGAVRVFDVAAFVAEVLEQEEEKKVQILDCRAERDFLGLSSGKQVSGHFDGAKNVPFASIFMGQNDEVEEKDIEESDADKSKEGAFLLPVGELRDMFEVAGIDLEQPVVVVASEPAEAAAVATALLISGHHAWIAFCKDALTDELVGSFPSSCTSDVFDQDRLVYADDAGGFDLSPTAEGTTEREDADAKAAVELEKAYSEELSGKSSKKGAVAEEEAEKEKVEEVVWVKDGHRFFDMPSPVSKDEFLNASRAIFRVVSFVLAPFGFPASLRKKRSLQEVRTLCGALFQDVIEVCSDLVYQVKELNEGTMAMSVHKWVEEKHDHDCTEQVKAINELWEVLYSPPPVVEVPDLDEDRVVEIATKLAHKIDELVSQRTPWAFENYEDEEVVEEEDSEAVNGEEDIVYSEVEETGDVTEGTLDSDSEEDESARVDEGMEEDEKEPTSLTVETEDTVKFDAEEAAKDKQEEYTKAGEEDSVDDDEAEPREVGEEASTETNKEGINRTADAAETTATTAKDDNDASSGKHKSQPEDKLAESWKYMYPSVIYTLGFIPKDVEASHKKLSTLQLKSFIQAVAEASWDVIGPEDKKLSQVEFQALCETLSDEKREQVESNGIAAEKSLYVLKHFLTRSRTTDDALADRLAGVREAVLDGDIRRRSGRTQVALANYSKAFDYLPLYHKDLEYAVVGRARCFIELNELARAKTEALIALKMNPYSVGAYECLGSVEDKNGHPKEAMQHYVTSFILDGSRSSELAECIDRSSRLVGRQVAKALFADMEKVHELPSAWLVESYFDSFEHDADYATSVPFDISKKRNKNFGDAQRDICGLVTRDMEADGLTPEQRALALNLHASLLYVAGDVHAAVDVINKSLELQPTSVNTLVKKGGFLAEMGETDEATSCFSEAMELDANDADVHLHLGQMELLDGDYYKAAQCLRRCISRSEELPVTHVTYGMALYKSGSTYQAKDVFEEASKKFPESAEVHLFHGEVLADQGNYADAMRHFLTAWELSPQCPLPFLNAGRVYVGTNDPIRAIAHFKQALEVDPRCSSAHLDIAQVLFAQGRTKEAFEHFDVAASCCRFLPEVEEVCACKEMAKMQLKVTEILGVELRHIMRSK